MEGSTSVSNGMRALCLSAVVILLATGLTFSSFLYQRADDPLCGRLGAGFPAAFVCDASGESPLSSVGHIDWADRDSPNLLGSAIDLLFYALILWGSLLLWQYLSQRRRERRLMQQMPPRYNLGYLHPGNQHAPEDH